ncbi:hypothetical protein B0H10DRAFT_1227199 [Mycena sp. CBHHK59/15]|nr:hypothetical protein B0H10DRAFT_1227199 [Mycena sp. CBHHK59/15]
MSTRSKGSTPATANKPKLTPKSKQKKTKPSARETDDEADNENYHSDALDEDSEDGHKRSKKRKRTSEVGKRTRTPRKKAKADSDEEEFNLKDGQEIVGMVVQAPKTGKVPAGQISRNTFDFLTHLKDPKCNDREWFKLHDPVYRQAEKEWKDFVEAFTDRLVEVDAQIPPLPPKDVIHRIYRDTRFSNDKTPYKQGLSASFSRSGRKGIFSMYHVMIKPGDHSMFAAGSWCPGKNELDTIRSNIQRDSTRLRQVISAPAFVKYFGKPESHPEGGRRNIFGRDDELKVAPKGVAKTHPDIDLLKCRSFCVSHQFTDEQVLASDFINTLVEMINVAMPLVHCLNDMMTMVQDVEEESENEE